jgi:CheY-like chemotaxis protein
MFKPIRKLLFIDDEPSLLELAPLMFDEFEVLASDNGASIIELINDFQPDIILIDLIMGNLNGLDVCETIRKQPEYKTLPLILMTAGIIKPDSDLKGADGIIEKPFDMPKASAMIQSFFEKRF